MVSELSVFYRKIERCRINLIRLPLVCGYQYPDYNTHFKQGFTFGKTQQSWSVNRPTAHFRGWTYPKRCGVFVFVYGAGEL